MQEENKKYNDSYDMLSIVQGMSERLDTFREYYGGRKLDVKITKEEMLILLNELKFISWLVLRRAEKCMQDNIKINGILDNEKNK